MLSSLNGQISSLVSDSRRVGSELERRWSDFQKEAWRTNPDITSLRREKRKVMQKLSRARLCMKRTVVSKIGDCPPDSVQIVVGENARIEVRGVGYGLEEPTVFFDTQQGLEQGEEG